MPGFRNAGNVACKAARFRFWLGMPHDADIEINAALNFFGGKERVQKRALTPSTLRALMPAETMRTRG